MKIVIIGGLDSGAIDVAEHIPPHANRLLPSSLAN